MRLFLELVTTNDNINALGFVRIDRGRDGPGRAEEGDHTAPHPA